MLRRLLSEDLSAPFTLIAFITALTIFIYITYRALRMSRSDTRRIADLPLQKEKRVPAESAGHAEGTPGADASNASAAEGGDSAPERDAPVSDRDASVPDRDASASATDSDNQSSSADHK